MKRRLFSIITAPPVRRKLFSDEVQDPTPEVEDVQGKVIICQDCGYTYETNSSSLRGLSCPKCGGVRFNPALIVTSPDVAPRKVEDEVGAVKDLGAVGEDTERRSLFGNKEFLAEFSTPGNNFEKKLKEFSGKEISTLDCEKTFSMTSEELILKNYAELVNDDTIRLYSDSFLRERLFSKLIVQVTKILDLDLDVPSMSSEDIIEKLARRSEENEDSLGTKQIMILKKIHGLPEEDGSKFHEVLFSDNFNWILDSGITTDLGAEFSGSLMKVKQFTDLLLSRYPDAPENIIDHLVNNGIVKINGNQVDII